MKSLRPAVFNLFELWTPYTNFPILCGPLRGQWTPGWEPLSKTDTKFWLLKICHELPLQIVVQCDDLVHQKPPLSAFDTFRWRIEKFGKYFVETKAFEISQISTIDRKLA